MLNRPAKDKRLLCTSIKNIIKNSQRAVVDIWSNDLPT